MLESLAIRPAVKSDIPQLVDLMNSQYSRKKDENYFIWQYFNSYYPTVLMCAFAKTMLIGMYGLQKRQLRSGAVVGQAIDLLVKEEWRRGGIFKLLGEKATDLFQEVDLLCVFPNENGRRACERAFNWKTVCRIDSLFLHKEYFHSITDSPALQGDRDQKKNKLDKFYYTSDTVSWRFDGHPDYDYSYIRQTNGEYSVTKVFQDPVTNMKFVDIVYFEGDLHDEELLRRLFAKSVIHCDKSEAEGVTTWALPGTPLHGILKSMKFTDRREERYFCVKILNQEYKHLYNMENWHLVQSDSEIY